MVADRERMPYGPFIQAHRAPKRGLRFGRVSVLPQFLTLGKKRMKQVNEEETQGEPEETRSLNGEGMDDFERRQSGASELAPDEIRQIRQMSLLKYISY